MDAEGMSARLRMHRARRCIYFMQREKNAEQVLRCLRETGRTLQNLTDGYEGFEEADLSRVRICMAIGSPDSLSGDYRTLRERFYFVRTYRATPEQVRSCLIHGGFPKLFWSEISSPTCGGR